MGAGQLVTTVLPPKMDAVPPVNVISVACDEPAQAARASAPIAIEVFMLYLSLCHPSVAVFSSGSRTATAKHGDRLR